MPVELFILSLARDRAIDFTNFKEKTAEGQGRKCRENKKRLGGVPAGAKIAANKCVDKNVGMRHNEMC